MKVTSAAGLVLAWATVLLPACGGGSDPAAGDARSEAKGQSVARLGATTPPGLSSVAGLGCSGPNSTGWCWRDTRLTGHHMTSAQYISGLSAAGWVIGQDGTLARTADGGDTWSLQSVNAPNDLVALRFRDIDHGMMISNDGSVLKTTDGGVKWKSVQVPAGFTPTTLMAYDASQVVLTDQVITYVSHDDGRTWKKSPVNAFFVAGTNCWTFSPVTFVSTNCTGKPRYVEVVAAVDAASATADGLHITLLVEQSGMDSDASMVSEDGGATWSLNPLPLGLHAYGSSVRDIDSAHSWIIDEDEARAYFSTDGGRSWTQAPMAPDAGIGVDFHVGLVDDSGALYQTWYGGVAISTDYGQTFTAAAAPEAEYVPWTTTFMCGAGTHWPMSPCPTTAATTTRTTMAAPGTKE